MKVNNSTHEIELEGEEIVSIRMRQDGRDITIFVESTPDGLTIKNGCSHHCNYSERDLHPNCAKILMTNENPITQWKKFELITIKE
jgi:hypothetical protein